MEPRSDWDCSHEVPWWKDKLYRVGGCAASLRGCCGPGCWSLLQDGGRRVVHSTGYGLHQPHLHLPWPPLHAWHPAHGQRLPAALSIALRCVQVGSLSRCVRPVRVKNMLTQQEATLEVPAEETIAEIRDRWAGRRAGC
jgi:hypothetical protein